MSQRISLKEVEQKAFKSSFQDGLVDIFIGCVVLQLAIAPGLSRRLGDFWSSVVFLPFYAIVYLVLWLIRKYVVRPRVGIVKFGSWRKSRMIRFNVVMLVMLMMALILGFLSVVKFDVLPGWIHMARLSLIMLVGFSLAGYFLDFSRLYLYGALATLSPLIGEWFYVYLKAPHHGFPITFGFTASLIIITGLVLFIRLLRDHPIHLYPPKSAEIIE